MADPADPILPFTRCEALEGVPHGFFGANDPAAIGAKDGLGQMGGQMGYGGPGDEREIASTRAAVAGAIVVGAPLVTPHQVHSPDVVTIGPDHTPAWPDTATGRPVADAVVSAQPGIVLGIVTADCGPVLLADAEAKVVAAAHAGWRGAQGGVLENTIAAMEALGARADRITAVLGPTISKQNYEVDAGFREHFTPTDEAHFSVAPEREGIARWHFDLPGYICARLAKAGVAKALDLGHCTYARDNLYHSYRRATHRGEPNYGRQLSVIAVPQ